jgi:hypothetical protein
VPATPDRRRWSGRHTTTSTAGHRRDRVAQRGSAVGAQGADRVEHPGVIGGGLDDQPCLGRERDQADPEAVGQLVDERRGGSLGRGQPVGLDIGRQHRARGVHREDHRRLVARHGDRHRRAGERDRQRGDRRQVQRGRQVPPPAGRPRSEVGQQVDVGEPDRVARPAALDEQVPGERDWNQEERCQQEGGREGHAASPCVRSWLASERSQLPDVDRTT